MRIPDPEQTQDGGSVDDRRHTARLPQDALLRCNLGKICDLSREGIRIRCKRIPTSSLLDLHLTDGREKLTLNAEVVWVNKLGFRKYEIGLHFRDLEPRELQIIAQFAMYNRFNRSF